jgi:hypothetical protein
MGILKHEYVHHKMFETREQAQLEIFEDRDLLQQVEDALGARLHEPDGVRREASEQRGCGNAVITA